MGERERSKERESERIVKEEEREKGRKGESKKKESETEELTKSKKKRLKKKGKSGEPNPATLTEADYELDKCRARDEGSAQSWRVPSAGDWLKADLSSVTLFANPLACVGVLGKPSARPFRRQCCWWSKDGEARCTKTVDLEPVTVENASRIWDQKLLKEPGAARFLVRGVASTSCYYYCSTHLKLAGDRIGQVWGRWLLPGLLGVLVKPPKYTADHELVLKKWSLENLMVGMRRVAGIPPKKSNNAPFAAMVEHLGSFLERVREAEAKTGTEGQAGGGDR